jgi:hypothetical protein
MYVGVFEWVNEIVCGCVCMREGVYESEGI